MSSTTIPTFQVIGISVRTTNENNQASTDIPALWNRFMTEGIMDKIPDKISTDIYCIYTDYEKDFTKPYTTIIGCKVAQLSKIPPTMQGKTIAEATYERYTAKGNILEGIVYNEWLNIWNENIQRAYSADFELYGEKTKNPANAAVDIFVAIK